MRKLWILLKLNFRVMLRAFSVRSGAGKSRGKAVGGIGALVLMIFLALYLSGVYSFLLTQTLAQFGAAALVLPLMALMSDVMALVFTLTAASGLVFGGKDNDIMLTLPVPAFTVVLGKVLALYLENLVFCGIWMLTTSVAYCMYAGLSGGQLALFCVCMALAVPFLPLLPSALALLGGWAISWASGRLRHKALVGTVLCIALFGAVMVGSMQMNRLLEMLAQNLDGLLRTLHTWLLPFGLLMDGLTGSPLALAGFMALSLVPFLALVWFIGTQYKRILSRLSSHTTRTDYKLREVKTSGQFAAMFGKECRRFFGSTGYLMNMGIGAVMLLGFAVYTLIAREQMQFVLSAVGGAGAAAPMIALILCFILTTVNPACVSISLEGKTLWLLKEAPVPPRTLFGAKVLLSLLLSCLSGALGALIIGIGMEMPAAELCALTALCVCFGCFLPVFGLTANLLLPRMDWENELLVIKQSASSFAGIFGGMLAVGLGALCWLPLGALLGFVWFAFLLCAVLLTVSALLWRWVCRRGAVILQRL